MEEASTHAAEPALEGNAPNTVGTRLEVTYEAVQEGNEVRVEPELMAIGGPGLTIRVEARVDDRIIGRGPSSLRDRSPS